MWVGVTPQHGIHIQVIMHMPVRIVMHRCCVHVQWWGEAVVIVCVIHLPAYAYGQLITVIAVVLHWLVLGMVHVMMHVVNFLLHGKREVVAVYLMKYYQIIIMHFYLNWLQC